VDSKPIATTPPIPVDEAEWEWEDCHLSIQAQSQSKSDREQLKIDGHGEETEWTEAFVAQQKQEMAQYEKESERFDQPLSQQLQEEKEWSLSPGFDLNTKTSSSDLRGYLALMYGQIHGNVDCHQMLYPLPLHFFQLYTKTNLQLVSQHRLNHNPYQPCRNPECCIFFQFAISLERLDYFQWLWTCFFYPSNAIHTEAIIDLLIRYDALEMLTWLVSHVSFSFKSRNVQLVNISEGIRSGERKPCFLNSFVSAIRWKKFYMAEVILNSTIPLMLLSYVVSKNLYDTFIHGHWHVCCQEFLKAMSLDLNDIMPDTYEAQQTFDLLSVLIEKYIDNRKEGRRGWIVSQTIGKWRKTYHVMSLYTCHDLAEMVLLYQ
jgi:hypothetical protein